MSKKSNKGSSVSPSSTTSLSSPPSPSPFSFLSHLRSLFSGRVSSSSPSSLTLSSLDGYRAFLCLWMIFFHTFFFSNLYLPSPNWKEIEKDHRLSFIQVGYLAVDGFFVLTGFLLTLPLFQGEIRDLDKKKESGKVISNPSYPSTSSPSHPNNPTLSFSIVSFWTRRFTRMFPSYYFIFLLYCGIFSSSTQPYPTIRSQSLRWFLETAKVESIENFMKRGEEGSGTNCAEWGWANILMINNLMPFGGCMGTTWSFAVTVQFYLCLPVVWKWAVGKYRKFPSLLPSDYLLRICHFFFISSIVIRVLSFFQLRSYAFDHPTGMFCFFWWYSSTWIRWNSIIAGIYVAYISAYKQVKYQNLYKKVFNSSTTSYIIQGVIYLFCLAILLLIILTITFTDGAYSQQPGDTNIRVSVSKINETYLHENHITLSQSDRDQITNPLAYFPMDKYPKEYYMIPYFGLNIVRMVEGLGDYWYHLVYFSFIQVGTIGSSMMFSLLLWLSIHNNKNNSLLTSILSSPKWYPISSLSMFAYFIHPTVLMKLYTYWTVHIDPNWELSFSLYWIQTAIVLFCTFGLSLIFHVLLEVPLDILLRRGEGGGKGRKVLETISKYFGIFVISLVIIGNVLGLFVMNNLPLPDDGAKDFRFRSPDFENGAQAKDYQMF